MKLSEAIALGRVLLPREEWDGFNFCSCALSMAGRAEGISLFSKEYVKKWPWLTQRFSHPPIDMSSNHMAIDIISYLFLCVVRDRITLDELIDWVRSVEPPEADCEQARSNVLETAGEGSVCPVREEVGTDGPVY